MAMSSRLINLLRKQFPGNEDPAASANDLLRDVIIQGDQREQIEQDKKLLEEVVDAGADEITREANRRLKEAAEQSLRSLKVIQGGRCPKCGEHIRQHLFAAVCDSCGWNSYEIPRTGGVKIHLLNSDTVLDGERAYTLKDGTILLLKKDAVIARLRRDAVGWVEYIWPDDELDQRRKLVIDQLTVKCAWCEKVCDPDIDGFHVAQVAFGANQERFSFCCDDCYEAFRKMYPSRVHRNCYERDCKDCNLCIKHFEDEFDNLRGRAKEIKPAQNK